MKGRVLIAVSLVSCSESCRATSAEYSTISSDCFSYLNSVLPSPTARIVVNHNNKHSCTRTFTAQRCVSAGTSYGPVSVSVTSRCSIKMVERIGLVLASVLLSTYPTLRFKEIQVSTKIRVGLLPHWNFFINSGLRKFRNSISIVEACYQLSSRKVDAQSVINWAVVSQLSW